MPAKGVGPHPRPWPADARLDPDLLAHGDHRNVLDQYRYWTMDAIRADIAAHARPFEVAVENLDHDFNIGSIVRTANALGAARVHIVGAKRWNRRGAMVTDRYMDVRHWDSASVFAADCHLRGLSLVGIDNVAGSLPLEGLGPAGLSGTPDAPYFPKESDFRTGGVLDAASSVQATDSPPSHCVDQAEDPLTSRSVLADSVDLASGPYPATTCLVFGSESSGLSETMLDACVSVYHITQFGSTRSMNVGHAAAIAMWVWANRPSA